MNSDFLDYYRCPADFATFALTGRLCEDAGYFRFGPDVLCYGQSLSGVRAKCPTDLLYDAMNDVVPDGSTLRLPFSPTDIVANLRYERYASSANGTGKRLGGGSAARRAYYAVRPILPVSIRKHLQRISLRDWKRIPFPRWPADTTVERIFERLMVLLLKVQPADSVPFIWFWPNGFSSCVILTHDVESLGGRNVCRQLMDLEDSYEVKSSFQIVPEGRYPVPESFLESFRRRGFEINVHDLNHDGHLFSDRELFFRRAERINRYGRNYGADGFRSAVLYRNQDWYEALDFAYDMSVPSVGHLDPQRGGCCSVMPFFIGKTLELPVTTTQDYSLFHILNQYSTELWKQQINLITEKHGLVSFIVHPDYLLESRARETYEALLAYLAELRSERKIWIALPREVNVWWRQRSQMRLVHRGNRWEIEGPGKERAGIAYASLEGDSVVYRLEAPSPAPSLVETPSPVAAD